MVRSLLRSTSIRSLIFSIPVLTALLSTAWAGPVWRPLGPDGSGNPLALVIDPLQPANIYVGAGNGVFKSVDGGASWKPASRGLGGEVAFSLAIDPLKPSTLYALVGRQVFKTTDGAATWFSAGCGLPADLRLRQIAIDHQNPENLYLATRQGVFKTTDGGLNWGPVNNGLTQLDAQTVATAASRGGTIYAGTVGPAAGESGVFRSTNGGVTWTKKNTGLTDPRISLLEVSPADDKVVLAGTFDGVFRTTNGGDGWQKSDAGLSGGSPFSLAFDPGNPSVVYAGAVVDGIFKSTDGGASWSTANNGVTRPSGLTDFGITAMAVDPSNSSRVLATTLDAGPGVLLSTNAGGQWNPSGQGLALHRVLEIIFDPVDPDIMYAAMDNRNGVYKSTDGGATWQKRVNGFEDEFGLFADLALSLAIDPRNRNTLYLGANGDGMFKTTNGASSWQRLSSPLFDNGFVTQVIVDPSNSQVVYAASHQGGVIKSTNGGSSWSTTGTQLTAIVNDIEIDPGQPSRLYATVFDGVFRSTNGGSSWSRILTMTVGSGDQLLIDPNDSMVLYLGTLREGAFKSTDRGGTWTPINEGFGELCISALAARGEAIYAATRRMQEVCGGAGVYRSLDGGETWSLAGLGLDEDPASALAVHPLSPETVYVGTDAHGIFRREAQPAYLYAAGKVDAGTQFDGLAFSNFSLEMAEIGLESIDALVPADQGAYPAGALKTDIQLLPGEQKARTRDQFFPGSSSQSAWLEQTDDVAEMASFFQFGSGDLSQLDGGVAITEPLKTFLFTRVFEGDRAFRGQRATTRLSIFNPGQSQATVRLSYFAVSGNPAPPARQITRNIAPRSYLEGSFAQLFQTTSSGGYIRGEVTAGAGVVAYELIRLPDRKTILGLNAVGTLLPGRSYSAQLASQAGIFTNVNLINSSGQSRRVVLSAIQADGSGIGQPQTRTLAPGQQLSIDAGTLFAAAAAAQDPALAAGFVGSLVVEADGDGVLGDVIFGDPDNFRYAAALHLQSTAFTDAVFSQVADVPGVFFTGLAFFYPEPPFEGACASGNQITIEVYRSNGALAGTAVQDLEVGERLSQLVTQLVPESAGQAGGFIRIRAQKPIIAQMLLGALDAQGIRLFSAVPPAVVR